MNGLDWESGWDAGVCSHKSVDWQSDRIHGKIVVEVQGEEATCVSTLARSMRGDKWGHEKAPKMAAKTTALQLPLPDHFQRSQASSFSRASFSSSACCCRVVRINKKFFDLLPLVSVDSVDSTRLLCQLFREYILAQKQSEEVRQARTVSSIF